MHGVVVTANPGQRVYRLRLEDGWYAVIQLEHHAPCDIGDRLDCGEVLDEGSGDVIDHNLDRRLPAELLACGSSPQLGKEYF